MHFYGSLGEEESSDLPGFLYSMLRSGLVVLLSGPVPVRSIFIWLQSELVPSPLASDLKSQPEAVSFPE